MTKYVWNVILCYYFDKFENEIKLRRQPSTAVGAPHVDFGPFDPFLEVLKQAS